MGFGFWALAACSTCLRFVLGVWFLEDSRENTRADRVEGNTQPHFQAPPQHDVITNIVESSVHSQFVCGAEIC